MQLYTTAIVIRCAKLLGFAGSNTLLLSSASKFLGVKLQIESKSYK